MLPSVTALASRAAAAQAPATGPVRVGVAGEGRRAGGPDGPAFSDTLRDAVDSVDQAQKAADGQVEAFVAGETDNVHDVMIALNQAELHFQLLTEVRNKLLEGYQEIMRMQV